MSYLSPEARATRWEKLQGKHGTRVISQARTLTAMLDYDNDFAAVDELAAAITAYGYQTVSNITAQVAGKSATNPNRHPITITDYLHDTRRPR